ncbi:TIGR00159 family protein [Parablautia intestinalis]|jgi:diadenylate cyclase|uniref:Diadenylate cyclase n=1 Tax=Parablautia intestinalis TaxID=2320100 RepID=A0A3A9AK29_9FIRM|nr:diadenylate cyclase CdaA [Parablautia intestinalis]MCI8614708.1 TIGR00159 family protein [Lachnospiraceae bacterium]MDE7049003.1 diadenylate cyclase CdaA [Lachnospiraceae bacterium]RKI91678.1 TIGR00159 family protein [Parablautia intestinalis]
MSRGLEFIQTYLSRVSGVRWTDIVEIIIISFLIYSILVWIKNTRAWSLLKGILVIAVFILIAAYFEMNTILWIVQNVFGVAVTAIVVILQPELRKAVEELGRKNIISSIVPFELGKNLIEGRFSDKTINEIARACVEMGKVKTGALIVVEQNQSLAEYERTGIDVDGIVTSQLLINIFEHNTPLHDGAVIVRGNRITSATCYLPLSDNMGLSKELGTRHRAGVGISEATDSLTIIVSEETGKISVAYEGEIERNLSGDALKEKLRTIQNKPEVESRKRILWKGRSKGEK